ncbi:MAG: A/G-specific adenine glycosylase [Sediminibacterium sp.]
MKKNPDKFNFQGKGPPDYPNQRYFIQKLLLWHQNTNKREMPWKGITDPYKIWLSEIILQQTRVAQGLGYYERLLKAFPTLHDLATARDADVFKLWEGLGYYSRCRNMLRTARWVSEQYKGQFPASYEKLLELPGIGPYTAAAIASFAFQLPYAVVDGNVSRVLARFFGIEAPIDSSLGRKNFSELARQLLYTPEPGIYNQAIMDFGATVCMPQQPLCGICPLQKKCAARLQGQVHRLPVKEKAVTKKIRWMAFFIFEFQGKWCVRERTGKDIWQHLFEFYTVETEAAVEWNQPVIQQWLEQQGLHRFQLMGVSPLQTQLLTHREIRTVFIQVKLSRLPSFLNTYRWVDRRKITSLPFPRIVTRWLEETQ